MSSRDRLGDDRRHLRIPAPAFLEVLAAPGRCSARSGRRGSGTRGRPSCRPGRGRRRRPRPSCACRDVLRAGDARAPWRRRPGANRRSRANKNGRPQGGRRDGLLARSGQREHEHAVAALEVELRVAAAATAMYCLPSDHVRHRRRVDAGAALELHSFLPVFASSALNQPLPSPLKTRPPAVASTPPISGCSVSCFHATLPVSRLTADSRPHCFSLGITLNAPPSHSLPPGILRRLDVVGHRLVQVGA